MGSEFSIEHGYCRLLDAKRGTRAQEDIIADLKSELAGVSELSVLTYAMRLIVELDTRMTSELYNYLESPMKQALYLIDVYYSMNSHGGTEELTKNKIDRISRLLDEIETAYFSLIAFPNNGDLFHDERDEKLDVALSSFLNYFCNAKLCYEEQTLDRILRYFTPYNSWIQNRYGFRIEEAMKFILHIRHLNNSKYADKINKGSKYAFYASHPKEWQKLTAEFDRRGLDPSEWAKQPELADMFETLMTNPGEVCLHAKEKVYDLDLDENIKRSIVKFFEYDKNEAGNCDAVYYADHRFSENRPLFFIGGQFACPINKFFLESLYNRLVIDLQQNVSKFKSNIDHAFENKVYEIFRSFFPKESKIFMNYSVDGVAENDLLLGCGTTWLVIEIKNTGFRPPMRDPLKAFDKIKTDFDKSVQLGYEQCRRVEKILLSGEDIDIKAADNKKLLYTLKARNITEVWSIVVTDFKYGPIQTDLSKLLRKEDDCLYLWSVCADDLEIFLLLLKKLYKGVAPSAFMDFLDYREQYHGHVTCFDELELCGWFLCNKNQFKRYATVDTMVSTTPGMGGIFDAYYKVGLGFQNELDIQSKAGCRLPEYSKDFVLQEFNNSDFEHAQG